jgi:hypothetical protein
LVMPEDLVTFAHSNGCEPINDFFNRPGMINPPYVYGWLSGDKEKTAAFWCKKTDDRIRPYRLVFMPSDPKQLGCPAMIEWRNPPGGLSIERRTHIALRNFRPVAAPNRGVPSYVVANAKVLVNYYDGLTDIFYCHMGEWLVQSTE